MGPPRSSSARLGGERTVWQTDRAAKDLPELDEHALASALHALAHPLRLQLLRALLSGAEDVSDLERAVGDQSAGRLYHHLGKLTEAGIVVQTRWGAYAVHQARVVPVLAVLSAAADVGG